MDMLAITLPMLCFAALLNRGNFRESILVSALANGLFIAVSTEVLSLFHLIDHRSLAFCWFLYLIALLVWRYRNREIGDTSPLEKFTAYQIVLVTLLACVVGTAGAVAIISAPNNFDSLTYHLPKMMHWIQNRSVEHYPTHIDRQLTFAPFAEFVIMHFQILSGGDRFANCVQWFSMVGSTVGVSLIVKVLKGSFNSQIVAAALSVSIPMGLLQSTSTQNDYVVTFWLLCLVYYAIKSRESAGIKYAFLVGLSLALAIFTKGTAYLVAVPFMLVYLWNSAHKGLKPALCTMLIIAASILLVNGSHYSRNIKIFGNPIATVKGGNVINSRVDIASIISCVTKNVVTQLTTGIDSTDRALGSLTHFVHNLIGVDVADPGLNMDRGFLILPKQVLNSEDYAPNPLHMLLMLISSITLVFWHKKYSRETLLFATATMLSFVALSVGIQWNPFISRYFLTVFIISAPFIALLYDEAKLRPFANSSAAALLLLSFFVLANNSMRPLVGPKSVFVTDRIDQYFMVNPRAKPYFMATAGMIKGQPLTNIGLLDRDGNMWEYLLWVLLKDAGVKYRIEHVGEIKNNSGKILLKDFSTYFPVRI